VIARLVAARYDEPSTRDARRRIVAFFRKHLDGSAAPDQLKS
jgi:carboxymethylenebutenolidase